MKYKKVVSFSGGRTSAYLCKLMLDKYGRENVDFVYMDTGAEHPKTYDFIRNVDKYFGLQLTCLRLKVNPELGKGNSFTIVNVEDCKPDLKPFKAMIEKYGVPYVGGMFCTDRMKLTPFKKYCDDAYGKKGYDTWLGIRADELPRVLSKPIYAALDRLGFDDGKKLSIYKNLGFDNDDENFVLEEDTELSILNAMKERKFKSKISYLAEISDFDKQDVKDWWSEQAFDLGIDEWSGNCLFCPKKSNLKLAASQRDNAEHYINYLDMIYSDSVRVDDNTGHWSKMYRGNQSLEKLIATFDGSTGSEIKARIRGGHHVDTNSCSESCEVFNLD